MGYYLVDQVAGLDNGDVVEDGTLGSQGFELGFDQSDQFCDQFKGRSAYGSQSRLDHGNSLDVINPKI